jgi:hopanoid biosynthesis associated protein HpnK
MVNEPACGEAVALARENPKLGVGLHLTLLCGRAACSKREIPDLVNDQGDFSYNPVAAGFKYYFRSSLVPQLACEIAAQFDKFRATGLKLDHLNGHLHMHLHPVIFRQILTHAAVDFGIQHVRLTRDPFVMNLRLARGRWFYRSSHALIHSWLAARARPVLEQRGIRHTQRVFGLLQDSRVDEAYLLKLLAVLPGGDSELYSHPSLDKFKHEFEALISPRVQEQINQAGIKLIRYQDL